MNSGLYGACAGLMARMQALDTTAANIANSSSTGFRGQQDVFGTVLAEVNSHTRMSTLNKATNAFSQMAGARTDDSQGVITPTGNDLDVAIKGSGYFKIKTANGIVYTRSGHFQIAANGRLTTEAGDPVLGDAGEITLGKGKITISSDGTISSDSALSGKLSVVTFPPQTTLVNHGGANYAAPSGAEIPATGATVEQGALEGSNVSPIEGVVQLISAQRAAESLRHALTLIDSDMDKTAVQDLARVS